MTRFQPGVAPPLRSGYLPTSLIAVSLTVFLVFSVTVCCLYVLLDQWQVSRLKKRLGCTTAQHVSMPLFGIPFMYNVIKAASSNRLLAFVEDFFAAHGNTFTQSDFAGMWVWTNDPRNVREVLSLQFRNFDLGTIRSQMAAPLLGRGIFTSDGEDWSHFRAAIRPNFTRAQVADLDMFEEHMENLLARIPKDGQTVDLQVLFHEYTMDISTDFLFGCSTGSLSVDASPANREFLEGFSYALGQMPTRTSLGPLMDLIPDKKFKNACKSVHRFVDSLVAQSLASREKRTLGGDAGRGRYIYLHELADSTTNPIELRDHAVNILVAGRDTTAGAMSFIFYLLARHPNVWRKVCAEVDLLNGKKPTYDDIRRLKYVNDVINEVLRLFPPVPYNNRVATADTILPVGGDGSQPILVRKGEIVFYSVHSMHRRKDLWGPDANEFRPERWESRQPGHEFLPFNAGPRICLGQTFAMTEMAFTIVRIAQTFESVESRDDSPWVEKLGLTLSTMNGVLVGLKARDLSVLLYSQ